MAAGGAKKRAAPAHVPDPSAMPPGSHPAAIQQPASNMEAQGARAGNTCAN